MKKEILLFCSCLLFSGLCFSQELTIKGKIGEADSVRVCLFEEGYKADTLVTQDGMFQFAPKPLVCSAFLPTVEAVLF